MVIFNESLFEEPTELMIKIIIGEQEAKKDWSHQDNDENKTSTMFKGVLHLWALFLKTLCIFSKNKATSDKVSYGSGQKCSKELENYSFTPVETIVVKLQ